MYNFVKTNRIYGEKSKTKQIQDLILGKKYKDAEKLYNNLRIVVEDNKSKIIIMNYCKERCNVEVENGIITKINGYY
jgi:hypothetical protein